MNPLKMAELYKALSPQMKVVFLQNIGLVNLKDSGRFPRSPMGGGVIEYEIHLEVGIREMYTEGQSECPPGYFEYDPFDKQIDKPSDEG